MRRLLSAVVIICLFTSFGVLAAEKKSEKKTEKKIEQKAEKKPEVKVAKKAEKQPEIKIEKRETGSSSQWAVSAGVRSREVDVSFSAAAPTEYADWRSLVRRPRNAGATSIWDGEARLAYEDGDIYEDPLWSAFDGSAFYDADGAEIGTRGIYNTVTFGATRTKQWSELSQTPLDQDDDATEGGVYVAARRALNDKGLSCLIQYGVNAFNIGSGWQETARQEIIERQTHYSITYDIDPASGGLVWLVADEDMWNPAWAAGWGDEAQGPRVERSARQRTLAVLRADSKTDLDVNIHDVLLALEWDLPLNDWFSLSVAAGPTLNVVAWDLEHVTEWVNETTGASLQTIRDDADDEEIKVGAAAQITARLNLDKDDRFFCEGSVGYSWLDEVEVKSSSASAKIDASSASCGVGFGARF